MHRSSEEIFHFAMCNRVDIFRCYVCRIENRRGPARRGDELSEHIVVVHKQLGLMSKVSSVCARARYIACARLLACASADK